MKKLMAVLLVALMTLSSISVMAANSPSAVDLYKITVAGQSIGKDGGSADVKGGSISVSKGMVEDGKQVTLTASAFDGKKFGKWNISGDFTIVDGSLTSDTITIIPNSDIDVDATFDDAEDESVPDNNDDDDSDDGDDDDGDDEEKTTGTQPVTQAPDNSNISPKTGVSTNTAAVVAILLLSCSGIAASRKKKND